MASGKSTKNIPEDASDCHFHIFNPQSEFPFSKYRSYTPSTATIIQLAKFESSLGIKNLCLVHGFSYGNDCTSLVHYLSQLNGDDVVGTTEIGAGFHARGVCSFDITSVTDEMLDFYHEAGVRSVRMDFAAEGAEDDVEKQAVLIEDSAKRILEWWGAKPLRLREEGKCKWSVQVSQEHVEFWPRLREVAQDLPLHVVVDHMAYVPSATGVNTEGFSDLLGALRDGNTWVKLSAPYRCSHLEPDYADLEEVVKALVKANGSRVVWGSDWPHILRKEDRAGSGRRWDEPEPFLEIDTQAWIENLGRWLGDQEWQAMWVENPKNLYG